MLSAGLGSVGADLGAAPQPARPLARCGQSRRPRGHDAATTAAPHGIAVSVIAVTECMAACN